MPWTWTSLKISMSLPEGTTSRCPAALNQVLQSHLWSSSRGPLRLKQPTLKRSDCFPCVMDYWLFLITKTTKILPIFHVLFIWQKLILTHYAITLITDIAPPYEGRASVDVDVAQGKANLKLSSITMADNKVYECRVQIPHDDEGKPVDRAKLVVLGNHWLSRESCVYTFIIFYSCSLYPKVPGSFR